MDRDEALRKLQKEELDILIQLVDYFERIGVTYFLYAGTALGAVRHGGFIPWDDDIDVGLMRDDYEKLIAAIERDPIPGCHLETPCRTPNYAPLFAKLCRDGTRFENDETRDAGFAQGIFVDIFPFDHLAADEDRRRAQVRNGLLWQKVSYIYHSSKINVPHKGWLRRVELFGCAVLHRLFRVIFSPERIEARFRRSILGDGEERSGECAAFSSVNGQAFPVDDIFPPAPASFEGHELLVPRRADHYLTLSFGDWRKLPAPEDRHTHLAKLLRFSDGTIWKSDEE